MRGLTPAAWTLFAAILIALGGQFLFACGFGLGGFFWNACPVPVDRVAGDGGGARRIFAAANPRRRNGHRPQARLEKPKPKEEFIRLQEKAYKRGAASGKLEVFLAWHTLDDVDLEIECPGGLISGLNGNFGPGICGSGKLDLDANRDLTVNIQRDPVEHIAWSDEPPAGEYPLQSAHLQGQGRRAAQQHSLRDDHFARWRAEEMFGNAGMDSAVAECKSARRRHSRDAHRESAMEKRRSPAELRLAISGLRLLRRPQHLFEELTEIDLEIERPGKPTCL